MSGDEDRVAPASEGGAILVECLNCGRRSTLDPASGAERLPLVQVTRRLRCSECGSRAVKAARIQTPRDVARLIRARMRSG